MVNAFGYYASSKGMVVVPDLSNLSRTAAIAAIEAKNLVYVDGGSTTTTNSALDDVVAIQLPNAGELVDYESSVEFTYFDYVPVPPHFPPFFPFFPFFPHFPPFFPFFPFFPHFPPSLHEPQLSFGSSGNNSDGTRYVVVYLTNLDSFDQYGYGTVSFSPQWDNFEGQYPEYIRDVAPNTDITISVTASKDGYVSATGSITVNSGSYTGPSPSFPPDFPPSFPPDFPPSFPPSFTTTTVYFGYCDPNNEEQCEIQGISGNVNSSEVSSHCSSMQSTFYPAGGYNWYCGTTYQSLSCPTCYQGSAPPSFPPDFPPSFPPDFPPSFPPDFSVCTDIWQFGNYWDTEECINGRFIVQAGYYEYSDNCGPWKYRDIVTYTDDIGSC